MVGRVTMRHRRHINIQDRFDGPKKVKAGFPAGKSGGVAQIAIWNHYGTRGGASGGGWGGPIPARPFLLNAIRDNRAKYLSSLRSSASKLVRGETNLTVVLSKLGALAQGDIQGEITSLQSPPNSPVTVALKGSSNPLIDDGLMRGAVTWELDE